MNPTDTYEVFQSQDGLWRAKFAPRIAKILGSAAAFFIQAQTQTTANELAGYLVSDALKGNHGGKKCK